MKTLTKEDKTYSATGYVYGNYWGGGCGAYRSTKLTAPTKRNLIKQIKEALNNGSLDGGMGYESLKGAIMQIKTKTTIMVNKKPFVNEDFDVQTFGKLTETEVDFLEDIIYQN